MTTSAQLPKIIQAGQVKANYTGLSLTGFTAGVERTFNINGAGSVSLSGAPTTTFPLNTPNSYAGVFDAARGAGPTGRLIENPINGQPQIWRVQATYANKGAGNNGEMSLRIRNLVSGFALARPVVMPSGSTAGDLTCDFITIADPASIPAPNGYVLTATSSFTDANYVLTIVSITRLSLAHGT